MSKPKKTPWIIETYDYAKFEAKTKKFAHVIADDLKNMGVPCRVIPPQPIAESQPVFVQC
jgi:hypothetical protein